MNFKTSDWKMAIQIKDIYPPCGVCDLKKERCGVLLLLSSAEDLSSTV